MTKEEAIQVIKDLCLTTEQIERVESAIDALVKQPLLPSGIDEAAIAFAADYDGRTEQVALYAFKAGAEWMAGQGVTIERTVDDFGDGASIKPPTEIELCSTGAQLDDKVIVQIRKK